MYWCVFSISLHPRYLPDLILPPSLDGFDCLGLRVNKAYFYGFLFFVCLCAFNHIHTLTLKLWLECDVPHPSRAGDNCGKAYNM